MPSLGVEQTLDIGQKQGIMGVWASCKRALLSHLARCRLQILKAMRWKSEASSHRLEAGEHRPVVQCKHGDGAEE
jgi:hypothetical protein